MQKAYEFELIRFLLDLGLAEKLGNYSGKG